MKGTIRVDTSPMQSDSTVVDKPTLIDTLEVPKETVKPRTTMTPKREPFRQSAEPGGLDSGSLRAVNREERPLPARPDSLSRIKKE